MIDESAEKTASSGIGVDQESVDPAATESFGFKEVTPGEKTQLVRSVFSSVASSYDVMNDAMSGGIHRLWKASMIDWLKPRAGMRILDVAGGTGDIAFRILDAVSKASDGIGSADVTVCDINQAMLEEGRDRAVNQGRLDNLDWLCGNAEQLPLSDASVDAYTIAFGIRNVTDIPAALREARRVLKPGGRFLCLEFSELQIKRLRPLYDLYSLNVIPVLGQVLAGDSDSYKYLVESIRRFPDADTFAQMIEDAGFGQVSFRRQSAGLVAHHSGWRI